MNGKKSILVIEDHECIRMLLANFLAKDYEVTTKADGLAALSWLSQGNIPSLIILDMSLPKLSGIEFLTNIRTSGFFSRLPVIIVTGEENTRFQQKCQELGISGYLTKPFNPLELRTKINITINQRAVGI